jgi:hypothetical protein
MRVNVITMTLVLSLNAFSQIVSFDAYLTEEKRSQIDDDDWRLEEMIFDPHYITINSLCDTTFINISRVYTNYKGEKLLSTEIWGCKVSDKNKITESNNLTFLCKHNNGNNGYRFREISEVQLQQNNSLILGLLWYFGGDSKKTTSRIRYVLVK